MKQILQNLSNGDTILEDIPTPLKKNGHVLIKTKKSIVQLSSVQLHY